MTDQELFDAAGPLSKRPGIRYVCDAPPGASLAVVGDRILVTAPDSPPMWLTPEGLRPVENDWANER